MSMLKSMRFTFVASLHLIILGTITLSAAASAADNQSHARFSTVLVPGQELREGITSLLTVPNGIYGSYEFDGKIVYFETRRGSRTPKHLRDGDPATPNYEIDVRFMNQDGEPFLIQLGGNAPLDKRWTDAASKLKVDAEAKSDFELAFKTVESLKKLKFDQKFVAEHKALLNLASVLESAQVVENIEGVTSQSLRAPSLLAVNTYRHKVEIHHKSCCLGFGRHSATIGKYISAKGVTTTAVITCNHGTCANQMALKCSWTSASPGNRTTQVKNNITCSTPYNTTSVFNHNSNDDTDLQYRAVRYNIRPSTTGGTCNNITINTEPTSCY
jgi:hypothetical protein